MTRHVSDLFVVICLELSRSGSSTNLNGIILTLYVGTQSWDIEMRDVKSNHRERGLAYEEMGCVNVLELGTPTWKLESLSQIVIAIVEEFLIVLAKPSTRKSI